MDENKNNEMSVDELLEKLKASLQADENEEKSSSKKYDDEELKKIISSVVTAEAEAQAEKTDTVETVENIAEEAIEEAVEETLEEVAEETADEEEAPTLATVNETDILAAWGIDSLELPKKEEEEEVVAEAEPEYKAPAASKTKAYYITRIENETQNKLRKQSEAQKQSVEYDRVDYSLIKQALGMEKAVMQDIEEEQSFEVYNDEAKTLDIPHAEFTYQRQRDDISDEYSKNSRTSAIKLILTAVFTLLLFVMECLPSFGVTLPGVLNSAAYPLVYSMATLQLVWLCGAVSYKEIANGFFSLLKFKFSSGSLLGIFILVCTACGAVCAALGSNAMIYHFCAAFTALVIRIFDYLDIRREMLAFDIASSSHSQKHVVLNTSTEGAAQVEGLEDYTGENSLILRTEKCTFVENYFARTACRSDNDIVSNKYLVPVLIAAALASFIIVLAGGEGAAAAFSCLSMAFAIGIPALVILSSAYPLYKAAKKLYKSESAIIGECSVEDYSGTTMICFDDADAFPSYGVGLESLRIYGNSDIETIIEQMGAVFSKLGGPLKNVFALMTSDCPRPYKVKVEDIFESGIKAVVDGKTLFIGSVDFMKDNGYSVIDTTNEIGGKRFSTMYLADEEGLRAKFFIRYTLDGGFESIVKKLARHGIASVILTGDSNINDELLAKSIDVSRLPVKVVRRAPLEGTVQSDRADSGIVSRGGIGDLVGAVTMCDHLARVISTTRAVRIATAVICAILMFALSALKMTDSISSLYVLVYHLFWLIPSWLIAKINL